ncbi:MAG: peptidoglycan -binding protein [Pseudomonadota bacterium]
MALARRNGQRFEANIWPGFVDAMTALLLVLVFVLSIFMMVQFMLNETITSQDSELDQLSGQVQSLAEALGLEQQRGADLQDELTVARDQSAAQATLIASLTQQSNEQSSRIANFEEQVAGLLAQRSDLESRIVTLTGERDASQSALSEAEANAAALSARIDEIEAGLAREITEKEAAQLALAQARAEIDEGAEAARLAAARTDALQALIADLERKTEAQGEALSAAEAARLADAAAAEALRERLANADAELTAMSLALEEKRQEAEDTLTLLAAANSAKDELDEKLLAALLAGQTAKTEAAGTEEQLRSRITGLEQQIATLQSDQADSQAARVDLLGQIGNLEAQIAALQSDQQAEETTRAELLGQISGLQTQLEALQSERNAEQVARANLLGQIGGLEAQIAALQTERDTALTNATRLQGQIDASTAREAELQSQLAGARAALDNGSTSQDELRRQLLAALAAQKAAELEGQEALNVAQQREILLATANQQLDVERAASAESQRQVEALNQQVAALRNQLGSLQALLDDAGLRDEAANVQISALGSQLNTALAQVAAEQKRLAEEQSKRVALEEAERERLLAEAKELKKYRSEFFGQLRQLLGNQDGVRIEGDRFVFSSEVLFQPARANLSAAGQAEIAKVADILLSVADDIPEELNWVIRVDGHTDNSPLSGQGQFRDNWELSQARALSVVRYMSGTLGIPPARLAANGFGEYQPINTDDTPEARAQNRRIELKLTEK